MSDPPAAEGAANKAVLKLIADDLGLPTSGVAVVRGTRSRTKVLSLDDADPAAIARRWPGLRVEGG